MSFPFCHCHFIDETSKTGEECGKKVDNEGRGALGGRGRGWTATSPWSGHEELSKLRFEFTWAVSPLGLPDLEMTLFHVGLWSGDQSWSSPLNLSGDASEWKAVPVTSDTGISGEDQKRITWDAALEEDKKSPVLILRGLCTGLDNLLLGALLAGTLIMLLSTSSAVRLSKRVFKSLAEAESDDNSLTCSGLFRVNRDVKLLQCK